MRLEPRPLSTGDLTNLELEGAEKEVNWAANESLISLLVQCSIYTVAAYLHGLLILVTPYAACLHVSSVSSHHRRPGPGLGPHLWPESVVTSQPRRGHSLWPLTSVKKSVKQGGLITLCVDMLIPEYLLKSFLLKLTALWYLLTYISLVLSVNKIMQKSESLKDKTQRNLWPFRHNY